MTDVVYHEAILPEHRGNPLIEALPVKSDFARVLPQLGNFPSHSDEERRLPAYIREEYLARLDQLRLPLPEYRDCFRFVQRALVDGYSAKSPFSPTTSHYLHHLEPSEALIAPKTGVFEPKGTAITVLGHSGVGKSKMIWQVLNYYRQIIPHTEYKGRPFRHKQVVWLYVEVPPNSSIRGVCHAILDQLERALGITHSKPHSTIDTLLLQIERLIRHASLGILAVDEIQNIDEAKAGGAERLLNFLLMLINRSGVPILLCGNPEVQDLLKKKFRIARRTEAGGFLSVNKIRPDVWPALMTAMWPLQWTSEPTPLTQELSDKLYELSAGILEIAVRVYKEAQECVIGTGDERISVAVLEEAFDRACVMTADGLIALRKADESQIEEDAYRTLIGQEIMVAPPKENPGIAQQAQATHDKVPRIKGDLTRPQHQEFADSINRHRRSVSLLNEIRGAWSIREASDSEDPLDALRGAGLLLDDPLASLS